MERVALLKITKHCSLNDSLTYLASAQTAEDTTKGIEKSLRDAGML